MKKLSGLRAWDNVSHFNDSSISASHVYKHPDIPRYVSRYSVPNDYHVVDGVTKHFIEEHTLIEVEDDPASVYDPDQLFETLANFGRKAEVEDFKDDPVMVQTIRRASKIFGRNDRDYLRINEDEDYLKSKVKLEKSGGIWFANKRDSWDSAYQHFLKVYNDNARFKPFLASFRTQRGNKSRLVYMSPTDLIIAEGLFAPALMSVMKNNGCMALGYTRVPLGAKVSSLVSRRYYQYSLDFSKFDSSVPKSVILSAFKILSTWFDMNDKQEQLWNKIIYNFIHGDIVMPDGFIYKNRRRGIPSGDWFTSMIGSISNYILTNYVSTRLGYDIYSENFMALGDDSLFGLDIRLDMGDLVKEFARIGMKVHPLKSMIHTRGERVHFLGFEWDRGRGYRDLTSLLNSAINPEKYPSRVIVNANLDSIAKERILICMSLTWDGLEQSAQLGLDDVFAIRDYRNFGQTKMVLSEFTEGPSNYYNFLFNHVIDESKSRHDFTFERAMFA